MDKHFRTILVLTLLATLTIILTLNLHVWEDGSWAFGQFPYVLTGCLPGGICS